MRILLIITASILACGLLSAPAIPAEAAPKTSFILVEAEGFADLGGWVVDQQYMDIMGSPMLLAHGLGTPVADAVTTVQVPAPGDYRVWVRTRDWVATWKAPGAPGKFQVLVDGKPLDAVFGTESAAWHWQDGGQVKLAGPRASLALHDLTGFEGRCDAILLSSDPQFVPPNQDPEMAAFRRKVLGLPDKPEDGGAFDLVVVGGGIAGTCAALTAARLDLKVALIQDRPVLGGNNSSEVRVWLGGARNVSPYPRVGDVVREMEQKRHKHYGPENTGELYEDERKLALVRDEKNITLLVNHRVNAAETADGRIQAVVGQNVLTGRRLRLAGRWFADCTGDGCVGFIAGADYEMTVPGHMGQCNLWNVADTGAAVEFPRCPWALDLGDKPFPGRSKTRPDPLQLGCWYWESGFEHDPILADESIRDWNFRAMYGAWDAMKNVDRVLPNHKLNWAAYVSGKRESRRLLGDVVLTEDDLLQSKVYPDGCVATGWSIDVHAPAPRYQKGFEGVAFISEARFGRYKMPYWVPYRCLYSRNVPNLYMAGRNISVTHDALGAVRVMRTCGLMGEIVGMAASLCKRHDTDPREVYARHLDELKELMARGAGRDPSWAEPEKPAWLRQAGENLARSATVTASSSHASGRYAPQAINDGMADWESNEGRWVSGSRPPHHVELAWSQPQTLSAARLISGYRQDGELTAPVADFVLQYYDGTDWKDITETRVTGNEFSAWSRQFPPVRTSKARLVVMAAHGGVARIWELELYGAGAARQRGP